MSTMTLKQYLSEQGLTYGGFAALIGVGNASVVWRYANGKRMPRPAQMRRIVAATGGAVTAASFYEQGTEGEAA